MGDLLREQLILANADLVGYIVSRLAVVTHGFFDREDLLSTGTLGLIKAVDRFDPRRGVKFETFASYLIRGEIMESMREQDPASRSLRKHMREMGRVIMELSTWLRRAPRTDEVADAMGMSVPDYQAMRHRLRSTDVISLDEIIEADPQVEAHTMFGEGPAATRDGDPAAALERKESMQMVSDGLGKLPERMQIILALYYGEELTLKKIGVVFGITESRVCQLHSQALKRLRILLEPEYALAA